MTVKVVVIGGGVFGATAACALARSGCTVELVEKNSDILRGASFANQGRLHYGYHYPRAPHVGLRAHADAFERRYPDVVYRGSAHFYCIASEGSAVSGPEYLEFCRRQGLPFRVVAPPFVRGDVQLCVQVEEASIDIAALRRQLRAELAGLGVRVRLGREATPAELAGCDWVIDATYGRSWRRPLQYEVCETVVVRLGSRWRRASVVVLDGRFVSLDPVPRQDLHLLYDVEHSVHARTVGHAPVIPGHLASLIDRGLVVTPHTRLPQMLDSARRFLPGLDKVAYVGSRFAVRSVLPDVDATDERPTVLERDGNTIAILSGKLNMAVWAADRLLEITGREPAEVG